MVDRRFFVNQGPFSLSSLAEAVGLSPPVGKDRMIVDVSPLDRAGPSDISFFDNSKYVEQFHKSEAGACFVRQKYAAEAPATMAVLITDDPYRCYAMTAQKFYPTQKPASGIHPMAVVDPTAIVDSTASIAAGAVICAHASVGAGSHIGENAVIGAAVSVGEYTSIGPLSSISHAIVGDRVLIHRGVHIGQDGFGFAMGREGHVKVPQLGRVIIENDVEIGSGTTIDRGTGPDTTIGEGTKIDNLVQIGHNVTIGKRVIIVAQCGISGSTRIGDGVVLAGQAGVAGHLKIGAGAKIAAKSGVLDDIPAGSSYGGYPAVPIVDWHRKTIAIQRLVKPKRGANE